MTYLEELILTIKREMLFQVISKMKEMVTPIEEVQELAREFLGMAPFINQDDLMQKLATLSQKYPDARAVFLIHAPDYYREKKGCLISSIRAAVEQGDLEHAVEKAYMRCVS